MAQASAGTISELAERNREYEDRFGFIFIVCASGNPLKRCWQSSMNGSATTPKPNYARRPQEQSKITRLRLEKLLNQ